MDRYAACLLAILLWTFLPPASFSADLPGPGVTEMTGKDIALGTFTGESGEQVRLKSLLDRPAMITFAYFRCRDFCPVALERVSTLLGRLGPGDYRVITISIDGTDGPEAALSRKKDLTKAASIDGRPFPQEDWRFLTGTAEAINELTSSIGFGFTKQADGFIHPEALVVVSPGGRIIRYMYGDDYLPADVMMALSEAKEARPGASIPKALFYCFREAPKLVMVRAALKASAALTLITALGGLAYLFIKRQGS